MAEWVGEHLGAKARLECAARELRDGMRAWLQLPHRLQAVLAEERPAASNPQPPRSIAVRLAAALLLVGGGALMGRIGLPHVEALPWTGGMAAVLLGAALMLRR